MNKIIIILFVLFVLFLIYSIYYIYKNYRNYENFHFDKLKLTINDFYPKTKILNNYKNTQKIPQKIHQTFKNNEMEPYMYESCMINKNMNPEYDYYYYNDNNVQNFIKNNYPQEYITAYKKIKPGAFKADFFRYLLLYKEGGVYIDCKSYTIKPLSEFIPKNSDFISFKDRPSGTIMNGFMACVPNHPILKICIDMCLDNILNEKYGINCLDVTGPQTLGRAYNIYNNKDELSEIEIDDITIIGSFITIGESYQTLADKNNNPLINRVCQNYYSITNFFNTYAFKWKIGDIYD
jgi:mannosyltransferase OCH1-like enzyme